MPDSFELFTNDLGQLVLRREGMEEVADVRVRRSFPWSAPGRFISIRGSDNKEILLIDDLAALDAGTREAVERALASATFIPRITRVDRVKLQFGFQQWKVETDRGPARFRVQEREDVRFLPDGRFLVKDADGNLYELPRLDELDEHSRRAVEVLI
jgi:hypothetical protein